ncbi:MULTISPECIES: hypothetical protein [Halomonadaceae]|uniref:Lipoprotein n=2 Tax=Vreelandella TaxID=3137766 RepID=A0A7Z0LXG2_9GAMM|nr:MULTISPECIES: hypothetical protein [Halomonas]NYS80467.1 hypothetical protein [Halomonas glaciei]|tara:strand:+ start:2459 stop:2920 length:462 start_codon:yes stop_codon:yes gene_type:complete
MNTAVKTSKGKGMVLIWFACWLALSGCTVKLIADYDPKTDEAITQLQRKFETFFVNLESQIGTEEASYDNHLEFYKEVKVDVSAIKLRASAIPKNEITLQQVSLLEENIGLLEEVHKEGVADVEVVKVPRDDFNTALSNILKLELAKRRGEEE